MSESPDHRCREARRAIQACDVQALADLLDQEGTRVEARHPNFGATPSGWAREGGHPEIEARLAAREPRSGESA